MIVYFESDRGCGIRGPYRTLARAETSLRRAMGTDYFISCRKASKDDIARVHAMGGWIPEDARLPEWRDK